MGINLSLFKKPQAQLKKDIEFVLVDKEAKPRDPNTRNRADMNSRSGGINDPKRKVSMPSPAPSKPAKPSAAAKSANKIIKQQQKQIAQQAKAPAKQTPAPKKSTQQQAAQNKPSPAKPAPPTARRHPDLYLLRHLRRNHHQALLFLHLKVHRLVKPFLLVL